MHEIVTEQPQVQPEAAFSVRAAALVHIDLTSEIEDWRSARYGRQVRAAQISALQKTMTQMNGAIDYVSEKGTEIEQTKEQADSILKQAQQINTTANQKAEEAKASASEAAGSAKTSESWAVGGTGTRDGENTNNSKYWSSQSQSQADRAKEEADRAAQYSNIVAPGFYLDEETMQLYMKEGVGVDFGIYDGVLAWRIVA